MPACQLLYFIVAYNPLNHLLIIHAKRMILMTTDAAQNFSSDPARWIRYTARSIITVWALGWIYIALLSVLKSGFDWFGMLLAFGYCLFFIGSASVAWCWDHIGGFLLLVESVSLSILYPLWMADRVIPKFIVYFELVLVVPAVISGLLFIVSWRKSMTQARVMER